MNYERIGSHFKFCLFLHMIDNICTVILKNINNGFVIGVVYTNG